MVIKGVLKFIQIGTLFARILRDHIVYQSLGRMWPKKLATDERNAAHYG
jgi:hypothetical protein